MAEAGVLSDFEDMLKMIDEGHELIQAGFDKKV